MDKNKKHGPLKCPKCEKDSYFWEVRTSFDGAYEDYHEWCESCKYSRWIDGADA